jgi:hypothetical protein
MAAKKSFPHSAFALAGRAGFVRTALDIRIYGMANAPTWGKTIAGGLGTSAGRVRGCDFFVNSVDADAQTCKLMPYPVCCGS